MALSFYDIIDISGSFSFAASGALAAMDKKLDPFGVLILSFMTAIGGGTIRDLLIGDLPVAWLSSPQTIEVILLAATVSMIFGGWLSGGMSGRRLRKKQLCFWKKIRN